MVCRVYVEKKPNFDVEAKELTRELKDILGISGLCSLKIINRYDVEGIDKELFLNCVPTVFSEPPVDNVSFDMPLVPEDACVFAVEYLPGQFDARANSASECIQLISQGERPDVRSAKLYVLAGTLTPENIAAIKHYVINPVEAREASLEVPSTLKMKLAAPEDVEILNGFCELDTDALADFRQTHGLAMDQADIEFFQNYFKEEGRDPSITEVRVVDTYWSDHCRHTTFATQFDEITLDDEQVNAAFKRYCDIRAELKRDKLAQDGTHKHPQCLMDIATIAARYLKDRGILTRLDESEEINACTVKTKVDVDGTDQDWLFLFKNETHNHPTEIEPFGGAATCIGGAIRDPLSGRSYVYQAMRVTGAGDPLVPVSKTMPGKLPQRKLTTTAAAGYSSYGNQIGLATGQVSELYHPGYVAKRMEIGAVVGATPADHVRRETPLPGDVIVLLGGRTGRDGIGGATGSSKPHTTESLESCGAEVQKGNPLIERKLQRLFRRKDACRLIKRCNDFGAGGVSVAIGELADGLHIDLDCVPRKYEGLDGTELAISESQERMAVALSASDVDEFMKYAHEENLEASVVATVSSDKRLQMKWKGTIIVDISRAFLSSNGAPKHQDIHVEKQQNWRPSWPGKSFGEHMSALVSDENICCNKGLSERFDSTIGAASVLAPFGGKRQLTPAQAMVAKLPVIGGKTRTVSGMAWGFNPYLMSANQYSGAYLSVVESVSKLVASGFEHRELYLSLQEYFERLRDDAKRWGKPLAALLGAFSAQLDLGIAAIGGKDSMSGSFEDLDVPPTLVSFACGIGDIERVVSPELKKAGSRIVLLEPLYQKDGLLPQAESLHEVYDAVEKSIAQGDVLAATTCSYGCIAEALFKMCLGNQLGIRIKDSIDSDQLFVPRYASFLLELKDKAKLPQSTDKVLVSLFAHSVDNYELSLKDETLSLAALEKRWIEKLEPVFPWRAKGERVDSLNYRAPQKTVRKTGIPKLAHPRVIIPVFPGNNCEYDSAAAFEAAGAQVSTFVVNNLTSQAIAESCDILAEKIRESQIIMLPGGFSGGDEPDGSAKFITAFFRAPQIAEAVHELLYDRDGLMLGICNGFQALIKLGLVPYGDIRPIDEGCPTLTFNSIARHQSKLVRTRITSNLSPWLSQCQLGDIHTIAISHGEGRFVASPALLEQLVATGQIATQYVDEQGVASMDLDINPNNSLLAVEGITSPDGRIFGKMGHSERYNKGLYKNVPGEKYQALFEGGVRYFSD